MFVVSNISSDVAAIIQVQNLKFGVFSITAEVIDTLLWFSMFFVLFRTVDDLHTSDSSTRKASTVTPMSRTNH